MPDSKSLQDNMIFLITFFGSLTAILVTVYKLVSLWIKEKAKVEIERAREGSAGKTAIEEIKETIKNDRDIFNKVLAVLQDDVKYMIGELIKKTKL